MKNKKSNLLENVGDFFVNLLYPPRCIFCGEITIDKSIICPPCKKALADELNNKSPDVYKKNFQNINKYAAVLEYNSFTKKAVIDLKHHGRREACQFFGELLFDEYKNIYGDRAFDAIIPVPMHKIKKHKKGFNQAELIAREISKRANSKVLLDCLVKPKYKKQQKLLSGQMRRENAMGAYKVIDEDLIRGKSILLVDDICTTGSTLDSCARILLACGAREVCGMVIASTVLNE